MRMLFRPLAVLALILPGVAAAEAKPQGAAHLTALLQTSLGGTPGAGGVATTPGSVRVNGLDLLGLAP